MKSFAFLLKWPLLLVFFSSLCAGVYLDKVKEFADNVLSHGLDVYGTPSDLFIDGIHIDSKQPAKWVYPDNRLLPGHPKEFIMANSANKMFLFRMLLGLSEMTGDPKYKNAVHGALAYHMEHLQHPNGLYYWGFHANWSADHDAPALAKSSDMSELKGPVFPLYEVMHQINPASVEKYIEAFWSAHIKNWANMKFNRHGGFGTSIKNNLWDSTYDENSVVPFLSGSGDLTFMGSAMDLYYAAACHYKLTGDTRTLIWAKRLAKRYVDARHPVTGLGGIVFSQRSDRRLEKQFANYNAQRPEGATKLTEPTITDYSATYRLGMTSIGGIRLAEYLGPEGQEFEDWAVEDLRAFGKQAYDSNDNSFWMMLIDGTRLSPEDFEVASGASQVISSYQLRKVAAVGAHFHAYALAYEKTGDPFMWEMARQVSRLTVSDPGSKRFSQHEVNQVFSNGMTLGDIGSSPGAAPHLDFQTKNDGLHVIHGLLALHRATGNPQFLDLARRVGDNAIASQFHRGFIVRSPYHPYCNFNHPLPLALLHLEKAYRGSQAKLPPFFSGFAYFHAYHEGKGRTRDTHAIYEVAGPKENNQAPQALIAVVGKTLVNGEITVEKNEMVQFLGQGSSDPDGDTLSYHWDFGDGLSSREVNPRHSYSQRGTFKVKLFVSDR